MRYKLRGGWLLLLITLWLLSGPAVLAQSANLQLNSLLVELWPEYDQPEVLVIYRGELAVETSLPAQLAFRLPGYVKDLHAAAIEQAGSLISIDPETIQLRPEGENTLLTFPVTARSFQFEYYDPVILTRQDQDRQIEYKILVPYTVQTLTFQVQEPWQAQNFTLTPEPDRSFNGQNGLTYRTIQAGSLASGETFELLATYSRSTDSLTASNLPPTPAAQPLDISVVSETPAGQNLNLGYLLVGTGLLLLIGAGGYWWWSRRLELDNRRLASGVNRSRLRRKKGSAGRGDEGHRPSPRLASTAPAGGYCYRCGAPLREDAEFCHACGAPRRRE